MGITVNIKMYQVGELGDCFLLRFSNDSNHTHVLIDCGSFRNGQASIDRLQEIASDISDQVKSAKLDIIVGTHQHNDHLSGFLHAKDIFKAMNPGQVWLSWLDDPGNKEAVKIGTDYNNYLTQLRLIHTQLKSRNFARSAALKNVESLLGFYGVSDSSNRIDPKTNKLPPDVPKRATEILRSLGSKKPKYLAPGETFSLPGFTSSEIKVYVLGPPKNEKFLYDKTPSKEETFDPHLAAKSLEATKILFALNKLNGGSAAATENEPYPFNEPYRDTGNYKTVWKSYYNSRSNWRQIEDDWLNQAERLALWLDGYTNNSSLVLAFEMVKSGKVLLFVGDAQTGNWNSWRDISWKKMPKEFNWLSLMRNTVFYKTGHHGSENATLVEGLTNMTHNELVTMISVDKSDGNITKKKHPWRMPAKNLYEELKKRCQDRVIRMDEGISKTKNWDKLPRRPSGNHLFWEYEVHE